MAPLITLLMHRNREGRWWCQHLLRRPGESSSDTGRVSKCSSGKENRLFQKEQNGDYLTFRSVFESRMQHFWNIKAGSDVLETSWHDDTWDHCSGLTFELRQISPTCPSGCSWGASWEEKSQQIHFLGQKITTEMKEEEQKKKNQPENPIMRESSCSFTSQSLPPSFLPAQTPRWCCVTPSGRVLTRTEAPFKPFHVRRSSVFLLLLHVYSTQLCFHCWLAL